MYSSIKRIDKQPKKARQILIDQKITKDFSMGIKELVFNFHYIKSLALVGSVDKGIMFLVVRTGKTIFFSRTPDSIYSSELYVKKTNGTIYQPLRSGRI